MPTYQTVVKEIFELQIFAIKLGLDNINALCQALDQPQTKYPVIHIAGTNGKGSTAFFTAALLKEAGLKCGLFTSPHLADFRERITIDDVKISTDFIQSFWAKTKPLVMERKATFFDTTTAMALAWFADQQVDVAIIETGLGGRLDSTNIVKPEAVVITPIDFDHEKQLGNTLTQITAEKAGIIKPGCTVFSAAQQAESLAELKRHIQPQQPIFYLPEQVTISNARYNLKGSRFDLDCRYSGRSYQELQVRQVSRIQTENQALACLVAGWYLEQAGKPLTENALRTVLKSKFWPGRLQRVAQNPDVFFDVSHNLAGIGHTIRFVSEFVPADKLQLLIGLVEDKQNGPVAQLCARYADSITVTEPRTHRRLAAEQLAADFNAAGKHVEIIKDLNEAYELCKNRLKTGQTLLVIGSHYLIGALSESLN